MHLPCARLHRPEGRQLPIGRHRRRRQLRPPRLHAHSLPHYDAAAHFDDGSCTRVAAGGAAADGAAAGGAGALAPAAHAAAADAAAAAGAAAGAGAATGAGAAAGAARDAAEVAAVAARGVLRRAR